MEIYYYNIYLLFFTLINNFNLGIILSFIFSMLCLINYLNKIDKYYSDLDQMDRFTNKLCKFIFNKNYSTCFTFIFLITYIFFIENHLYPFFEITMTCLTLYHIISSDTLYNLNVYILFISGCINCLIYEYYVSKFITVRTR